MTATYIDYLLLVAEWLTCVTSLLASCCVDVSSCLLLAGEEARLRPLGSGVRSDIKKSTISTIVMAEDI
jgi:hypothetical protein